MESFLKLFNQSKLIKNTEKPDDDLIIISGFFMEAAAIDGIIDDSEISKIKKSLINIFEVSEEKSNDLVKKSLERVNEPNSLYYFTSKINKEFEYDQKIELLEILWGIILADGKIHDFESNLVRRLSGLLYVSDIDCGNAKKRASTKVDEVENDQEKKWCV